jgi:hypothetical protein
MIQSLSYGELPKFESFEMAFKSRYPRGVLEIRNEPILNAVYPNGNVDLTMDQTWLALNQCAEGWRQNHELGDIGDKILNSLGFEWI